MELEKLSSIPEILQRSASVKTIFGDPISAEGRTVIPVARTAYGFGNGFGRGKRPGTNEEGEGGGGGGGISVIPVGALEISATGTRFIALRNRRKLAGAVFLGLLLGWRLARRSR